MRSLKIRTYKNLEDYVIDLRKLKFDIGLLISNVTRLTRLWHRDRVATLASEVIRTRGGKLPPVKAKDKTSIKTIKQKSELLVKLLERQEILNAMVDQLEHSLSGQGINPAALAKTRKEVAGMKATLDKAIKDLRKVITNIAKGRLPEEFRTFCNKVNTKLQAFMAAPTKKYPNGRCDTIQQEIVASIDEQDRVRLDYYLEIKGLVSDSGHVYSSYYVVFSMRHVDDSATTFHAATMKRYRPPGFKLSEPISSADKALALIVAQLRVDSVMDRVMTVKPPIAPTNIEAIDPGIKSFNMENSEFVVRFTPQIRKAPIAETIMAKVQVALNKALKAEKPLSRIQIRPSKIQGNPGSFKGTFRFISRGADKGLNIYDFPRMQQMFDLTDADMEQIKQALGVA